MLVGLISDTHDDMAAVAASVAFLRRRKPDLVIHLGDVTTKRTLAAFEDLALPLVVLRGNNDPPGLGPLDWSSVLEGVHVHAHHGHLKPRLEGEPDLLLHGHTHRRRAERVGRTLVVNPGALHRAPRRTIALLRLPQLEVEFHEVTPEGVRPLA